MAEAETSELLTLFANRALSYLRAFVSFTFAYLSVAYFVGKALSGFQCISISMLYLIAAIMTGTATVSWPETWDELRSQESSLIDNVSILNGLSWT